jgi:hypothetical protein
MPVGQSAFLVHGVPATPLCGWVQVSFWHTSEPLQVTPEQHTSDSAPQVDEPVVPVALPLVEAVGPVVPRVELPVVVLVCVPPLDPPLGPELPETAQMPERQTKSPLQVTKLQHAWPCPPQAGVELLELQAAPAKSVSKQSVAAFAGNREETHTCSTRQRRRLRSA